MEGQAAKNKSHRMVAFISLKIYSIYNWSYIGASTLLNTP